MLKIPFILICSHDRKSIALNDYPIYLFAQNSRKTYIHALKL